MLSSGTLSGGLGKRAAADYRRGGLSLREAVD
jgi:hypothetical protein